MRFEADTIAVAGMAGVSPHTIRNWANRGYLQPLRVENNRTIYDVDAVIKAAAARGYLADLREQDDGYCCLPRCEAVVWPGMDIPLCRKHAVAVWVRINDELHERLPETSPPDPRQPVVYFAQAGDRIKIGTSTTLSLKSRLDALSTSSPEPLRVLLVVAGGYREEKQVHALFSEERVRGEWFRPSQRLLDFIAEREDQDVRTGHGQSLHVD